MTRRGHAVMDSDDSLPLARPWPSLPPMIHPSVLGQALSVSSFIFGKRKHEEVKPLAQCHPASKVKARI